MRAFTAAAVQVAPVPGPLTAASVAANLDKLVDFTRRCVEATGAELVVLPESATTGFTPGCPTEELWELVSELPGPVIAPLNDVAAELGIHLVAGTYERGPSPEIVYNSSVLIDPRGELLGVYRKTHPFCSEAVSGGGWVTPGDTVTVCDTELGRIGMIICFDGDYPELSRIQAVQGAEVICRPSALLRSADIWELTSRARAYDNHVFVVGANAVGVDPAGVLYFGNSHVVTPIGHIVAKAATHEGWVSARLDPEEALSALTPGSNITQGFDHLRDRNLDLIRNHRAELEGPGEDVVPARLSHLGPRRLPRQSRGLWSPLHAAWMRAVPRAVRSGRVCGRVRGRVHPWARDRGSRLGCDSRLASPKTILLQANTCIRTLVRQRVRPVESCHGEGGDVVTSLQHRERSSGAAATPCRPCSRFGWTRPCRWVRAGSARRSPNRAARVIATGGSASSATARR